LRTGSNAPQVGIIGGEWGIVSQEPMIPTC